VTAAPDVAALVAAHPFFRDLGPGRIAAIAAIARVEEHPTGSWIGRAGTPVDEFHAVVSGRAAVEIDSPERDPLVVSTIHGGEVIGWSWFVPPHQWRFDVVALDTVESVAIDAAGLRRACDDDPALGHRLAQRLAGVIASRLEATRHQLVDVYGPATTRGGGST
jgi:CRP/FNR family cyclic AMP-dependent transcriptional regulator